MADEHASANRRHAAEIVAAYLRRNQVPLDQIGLLITNVYESLERLAQPAETTQVPRTPAVPIRQSVTTDAVICLECGWKGKVLRRHLMTSHGLSVDEYRRRWGLPGNHPMIAPSYSERRVELAKQLGLGRGRRKEAAS
jgi:predicted transcriptional regulator